MSFRLQNHSPPRPSLDFRHEKICLHHMKKCHKRLELHKVCVTNRGCVRDL
jgi:hypothetical protein